MTPLAAAQGYIARGWAPVPIPYRKKAPVLDGWPTLRVTADDASRYFNGGLQNIGILLGQPSGNLVDADLDCAEALALADSFLPPTESVFGRAGKLRSHRCYFSALPKRIEFVDPDDGEMLLELRSTGGQTVFPGSTHESGERIEWFEDGDPTPTDAQQLTLAGRRLAGACLLARAAPVADRHNYLLEISGALVRGLGRDGAASILSPVARHVLGNLYTEADGKRLLDDTARKLDAGEPVPGWPRLAERIGEKRARKLSEWLVLGYGSFGSASSQESRKSEQGEWPDPAPLPEGLPAVQPFDAILLPDRLRPWITDIAERMQVPLDFPAIAAVVGVGAVVGRKMGIRPKRCDDWTVIPNLFGGIVGRPGLLKTPALQEACRPLIRLEMTAKDEFKRAHAEYEAQQRIAKQQKKLEDDKIAKDLKANRDPKGILHDLLAGGEEDQPPARRRYLVNDCTIEKLGEILAANPNGVMIFRDELTGFLRQMDRDGHEQDRAFYLEAWNGSGRFTYDRIGRGTIDIEACCVSLLGGIQPGPLSAYMEGMAHGGAGDDGLIQRLQLLVWPDVTGAWANVDRAPDSAARAGSEELFDRLDTLIPIAVRGEQDTDGGIPFLRFDSAAQGLFDEWRCELETRLRSGQLHPALESHLAKYRSLVPSIALLCHLVDSEAAAVSVVALERAIAWAEYLESHARRVYDAVIRGDLCAARALGERVLAGDLTSPFSLRDVYRPGWSGISTREAAASAIGVLVDLDWLRVEEIKSGPAGGRPTSSYHVNPKLGRRT